MCCRPKSTEFCTEKRSFGKENLFDTPWSPASPQIKGVVLFFVFSPLALYAGILYRLPELAFNQFVRSFTSDKGSCEKGQTAIGRGENGIFRAICLSLSHFWSHHFSFSLPVPATDQFQTLKSRKPAELRQIRPLRRRQRTANGRWRPKTFRTRATAA